MKEVNNENFNSIVNSGKPVLVDFWAEWCGPCRMLSPIVDELSNEITSVDFCKCNVDDANVIASKFAIQSIPTIIIFKNGEVLDKRIGASSKASLKEWIEKTVK